MAPKHNSQTNLTQPTSKPSNPKPRKYNRKKTNSKQPDFNKPDNKEPEPAPKPEAKPEPELEEGADGKYRCVICQSRQPIHAKGQNSVQELEIKWSQLVRESFQYDFGAIGPCPVCTTIFITVAGESTVEQHVYNRWKWALKEFGNCRRIYEYPTASRERHKWYYEPFDDAKSDEDGEGDYPSHPRFFWYRRPSLDQKNIFGRDNEEASSEPAEVFSQMLQDISPIKNLNKGRVDPPKKEGTSEQILKTGSGDQQQRSRTTKAAPAGNGNREKNKKVTQAAPKASNMNQKKNKAAQTKAPKAFNASTKRTETTTQEAPTERKSNQSKRKRESDEAAIEPPPSPPKKLKRPRKAKPNAAP